MKKKLLLSERGKEAQEFKEIAVFENPERMKNILNKLTWKILTMLGEEGMYPMEVAKRLGIHEQIIYYHVRKLAKVGAIKLVREEERKGAVAKYYRAAFPAFGVELPFGTQTINAPSLSTLDTNLRRFLSPIIDDKGSFAGEIVVGSPAPHGPFKTIARDGHYASYLAFFMGNLARVPDEFVVKLDVDVKAERDEAKNLILVGGPGTNLLTQEINDHLPIRFNMAPSKHGFMFGGLFSTDSKNVYTDDSVGLAAKIVNPWNKEKRIIVLAGNKSIGTKACVIGLVKFWKQVLENYTREPFATVLKGFDLDGDGKIDSVEVLE
ncbi:MAG TPA: helix-turn-helix domain-containing protein [Candidatus Bathyarchaeia archaeon]|nr:helix-turn-helix domain-containing protein [Candidatus Bathyarchaeia archaeon]